MSYLGGHTLVPRTWFGKNKRPVLSAMTKADIAKLAKARAEFKAKAKAKKAK
jgi:hypothetical protein